MLAPRARFELATLRLTAECSTVELPGIRATRTLRTLFSLASPQSHVNEREISPIATWVLISHRFARAFLAYRFPSGFARGICASAYVASGFNPEFLVLYFLGCVAIAARAMQVSPILLRAKTLLGDLGVDSGIRGRPAEQTIEEEWN
jgi:hypothetical protein